MLRSSLLCGAKAGPTLCAEVHETKVDLHGLLFFASSPLPAIKDMGTGANAGTYQPMLLHRVFTESARSWRKLFGGGACRNLIGRSLILEPDEVLQSSELVSWMPPRSPLWSYVDLYRHETFPELHASYLKPSPLKSL